MADSAGKRVLFLCSGNSARSQMAEGLLRHLAGDVFDVFSAGTKPRPVHPLAVEVMAEIGVDISAQSSKGLDALAGIGNFLFLIIVCAEAESHCPSTFEPAAVRIAWPLRDPAAARGSQKQQREVFRQVRDQIRCRVLTWLSDDLPAEWFPRGRKWIMKRRVLILCTGNSCRSQMAEGLWRSLAGDAWEAYSAGSKPAGFVHPLAVRVMAEASVDIAAQRSKHVNAFTNEAFDLVVTVCDSAKESCPILPGAAKTLHWPFSDPAEAEGSEAVRLTAFRRVRDDIQDRIRRFLAGQAQ